jgi:hypothetical protein
MLTEFRQIRVRGVFESFPNTDQNREEFGQSWLGGVGMATEN